MSEFCSILACILFNTGLLMILIGVNTWSILSVIGELSKKIDRIEKQIRENEQSRKHPEEAGDAI